VLIKVESAPINPSDLGFLRGSYSSGKKLPTTPGFEGSGTVVLNGGGIMGWALVGKKVAVAASGGEFGTYAEYCVADAASVISVPPELTFNEAACTFVNPLTVIAFCEIAKEHKVKFVVHSAAAS